MNLALENIRLIGRQTKPRLMNIVRELTPEDLPKLMEERGVQKPIPIVRRIGERHRNIARMIAMGKSNWQIAAAVGIDAHRVSLLRSDPSVKELVAIFTKENDLASMSLAEKLAGVTHSALDEIQERLEVEPEKISIITLLEISKVGADRTGHGPQSTNVNVNVNLADRLEAARKRVTAKMIEGTVNKESVDD